LNSADLPPRVGVLIFCLAGSTIVIIGLGSLLSALDVVLVFAGRVCRM